MKTKILISTLALATSTGAFASKARVQALQKAEFLKDVQTAFINPAHINSLGQFMTVEFGGNTNASNPKAEGGIFAEAMGANMGLYLGHLSQTQQDLRTIAGQENQNNPIEVFYAKDSWGASIALSNHKDKTTDVEEKSVTARFGYDKDGLELFGTVEAIADAENATDEYTGGPQISLGAEKAMGDNYVFAKFNWGAAENKVKAGGAKTDVDVLGLEVGAINRKIQNVYYGVSLAYDKLKIGQSITALTLPVFIGVEANLTSWAVVRASVVQSVLISSTEDKTQTAPADGKITNKNDTTVAAGIGIKYNKFTLDGVIAGSTTGDLNGNDVLTQASLSYEF